MSAQSQFGGSCRQGTDRGELELPGGGEIAPDSQGKKIARGDCREGGCKK